MQAPFYPAEGLLTLRRSGLVRERALHAGWTVHDPARPDRGGVRAERPRAGGPGRRGRADGRCRRRPRRWTSRRPSLPKRPAYARGELNLSVPPLARTLTVEARPQADKLEPGGTTQLDVVVKDAQASRCPNAELADRGRRRGDPRADRLRPADPLTSFYGERSTDMTDSHNRGYIVLANPMTLDGRAQRRTDTATGAGGGVMAAAPAPAAEAPRAMATQTVEKARRAGRAARRTRPSPSARTSTRWPTGRRPCRPTPRAAPPITVKVPDNLTRYRVMVVAVAGGKAVRQGRVGDHRPAAADGAAVPAALPELRRPVRAAGRRPEPDRQRR